MSKNHLLDVLSHKTVDRPAWVPFAGVHAGLIGGHSPKAVLTDATILTQALKDVHRLYQPDGMPVSFDLQLEAEMLGCELKYAPLGPPQVVSHPLQHDKEMPCECLMPDEASGRLSVVLQAMRTLRQDLGDTTALYGLVCGPLTLASHLRGTGIFIDMYDDMDYVKRLIAFCTRFIQRVASLYIDAGADVIAVVDPLVSQISTEHFISMLHTPYLDVFTTLREQNVYSSFFVCGDATRNIEAMCATGPDSISIDENINMTNAKKITDRHNIVLGGNIPLTTIMLHGSQQDNMKYVVDMVDGLDVNNKNLIVSPGCDMPYETPVENTIAIAQAVRQLDATRNALLNYQKIDEASEDIKIPDYDALEKPLLEVFTLDSATCAACTYMKAIADDAKKRYGNAIDVVEHKYTEKETIARCQKMGVKNLPSIYINGELRFASIIPSLDALCVEIDKVR